MDFPATVAPFILRGVSLLGIDSVMAPKQRRMVAWKRLSDDLDAGALDSIAREIGLAEAITSAEELMGAQVRGRIIVDVNR
jgi:acrylyl-CoA reductase (NADPH)